MSDFLRVLDTTERHLLTLKGAGVRFLSVQPETLRQLREPPPIIEQPAAVEMEPAPERLAQPAEGREGAMAALRQRASACVKCPHLAKSRKNVVFGVGDIHAQLMFMGEAPGA